MLCKIFNNNNLFLLLFHHQQQQKRRTLLFFKKGTCLGNQSKVVIELLSKELDGLQIPTNKQKEEEGREKGRGAGEGCEYRKKIEREININRFKYTNIFITSYIQIY